jgi:hypothetical protein
MYKKTLPIFPLKIGVITSESGAALQDILNISSRRFPMTEIVVFPALVQGISAPQSLINALNKAFKAVVDATEESILKSMLYSNTTDSYNGKVYKSLNEYKELFVELLEVEDD